VRVLVIGGTGFIGPVAVSRLVELGHEVICFHRSEAKAELPDAVEHVYGDRKDLVSFRQRFAKWQPDVVLDMICLTEEQAQGMVAAFRGIAGRTVVCSSQDVYRRFGRINGDEDGAIEEDLCTEESPLREKRYYYRGKSQSEIGYWYDKVLVERTVMSEPELPGTVLRLPATYGPRDYQHRLYVYLKRMADGRPAIVMEEGWANWRWTKGYVENVAEALLLAVVKEEAKGRIYNVGEREALSNLEWVQAMAHTVGWRGEIVVANGKALPDSLKMELELRQHMIVDSTRIREELGFAEPVPFAEGMRRTVEWELANPPAQVLPERFDYEAEDAVLSRGEGILRRVQAGQGGEAV
jgi:nucleoside-diphosphate-sugar epimerase